MDIRRRAILSETLHEGGSSEGAIDIDNYLTIEARENGLTASLSTNVCEYCVDGDGNWKTLAAGTATKSINSGQTLSFRGELYSTYLKGIGTFTISKKCNLKGNCMSMLFGDNAANNYSLSGKNYAFYGLCQNCTNIVNVSSNFLPATTLVIRCYNKMFQGCTSLKTAPELPATTIAALANNCYSNMFDGCTSLTTAPELPATTLSTYCYYRMFYGCTSLTNAPELPATILTNYCYSDMFNGCTSLTAAPELPATSLADHCYYSMFYGCTSLINAPYLPATTLVNGCYDSMFNSCTSLTTAPELLATTLADNCYGDMFRSCTKLNYIKMLATDISAEYCLNSWVDGVASSGTFVKNLTMNSLPRGANGIPRGWIVVNDGEESVNIDNYLTIEALEDGLTASLSINACEYCVDGDANWKSLAAGTATESINSGQTLSFRGELYPTYLKGIGTFTISKKCNLKGNCMSMLFGYEAADNFSLSGKNYAFYGLCQNCTNIVNVSSNFLPATSLALSCYNKMFQGCTSLITPPELPATTLAESCYGFMFMDCTSLTTAPELPATTLSTYCYYRMLYGCTSLTNAPELPATILTNYCYSDMFNGCTSLITAPELPATTLSSNCYYSMFYGCTSLVNAPDLPATTLADYCYRYMFQGCTSLTTAPELPATTLSSRCYGDMFKSCTKLNYIKMLATDISAEYCLNSWVDGVASSGTFVKNPAMTSLPTGTDGIPRGWTVVNDGEENNTSISLCDVAYWDGSAVKTCSYNNYNTSLGTAIGVVVIPEGFAPDGKARIVGLKPMDSFGMTNSYKISLYWDASGNCVDTSLTNYTKVPTTDNVSSNSTGSASISNSTTGNGCLPSDKFTGIQSYVDAISKYSVTSYLIPSPYSGDTYNPEYYKTISGNNALSDFNGLSNTQALVSLGSNYQAANYCWDYNDGSGSNIQWYLPAMGELGYLMPRLNAIDEIIVSLGGVAVQNAATLWSSSEYDSENVNYLELSSGRIRRCSKVSTMFARSFATIDNGVLT